MKVDSTRLAAQFESIALAAEEGRTRDALRLADSARRYVPDNTTARLVHARSLLRHGLPQQALKRVEPFEDADSRLLLIEAAIAADEKVLAMETCQALLAAYAVDSLPELAGLAGRVCQAYPDRWAGWMGIDTQRRLIGETAGSEPATLEWEGLSSDTIAAIESAAFCIDVPLNFRGRVAAQVQGRPLLGSNLLWPADFGVSGWVMLEGRQLCGEVAMRWHQNAPLTLVLASGRSETRIIVPPGPAEALGRPFTFSLAKPVGDVSTLEVAVLLPDGGLCSLVGSPLSLRGPSPKPIAALPAWQRIASRVRDKPRRIDVVIPVYAGFDETMNCLRSVLDTTSQLAASVIVVDDASPDEALCKALDALAAARKITLIRNPINLGFPGAANRGMRVHTDRDVVLLNADTEVFDGWLERLNAAAYARDGIGTATPLGEAASIVSLRSDDAKPFTFAEALRIDRIARIANAQKVVEIPVGVGFCLFIRRQCLDAIGELDEKTFSRGYGEENDFCLRARRRGWRHVAAPNVFVRHVGNRSFGRDKITLMTRNHRVINFLYPGYDAFIQDFIAKDPLRDARRAIDQQRFLESASDTVLLVTLELGGGVERHVEERRRRLIADGHSVLVLRPDTAARVHPGRVRLDAPGYEHLRYEAAHDVDELRRFLGALRLTRIEINHFLGLPVAVFDVLLGVGARYRVVVHDFVWLCPRVAMLDGVGVFCGEPPLAVCEACVQQHGAVVREPASVQELRNRSAHILEGAEDVVVPTEDTRARYARYFPSLKMRVEPWEPTLMSNPSPRQRIEGKFRVLLIGGIRTTKGYAVLLECARDAAARDLSLEFVIVGFSSNNEPLLETGRVFITGAYREDEVDGLLEREDCDVAFFPSVGPETWCYALSYAMARGMPIVALDLGAVAERLREAGTGVVLPLGTPAGALNDELLRVAADAVAVDQNGASSVDTSIESTADTDSTQSGITSTVQVLDLPAGLYAFSVQSGAASMRGGVLLPALQVAPAPVHSKARIEFLSGPSTLDRWLTAGGDVVTVKISGGEASLLLTSIRTLDSGVLSIDVRRLDGPPAEGTEVARAAVTTDGSPETRVMTLVHVPYLGDLTFVEGWAGKPSENLWIEGFSVHVEEPAEPQLVEYCSVSEDGDVSEWLSGGEFCGARGTGVPLVAFAMRVKAESIPGYTCFYSGRFLSGNVVGPFDNGRFCRSEAPGDPLVAMELRLALK